MAGVTLSMLKGRSWRRVGSELYCWRGLREDNWRLLKAWQRRLPADAVFAGPTAAWMLGLDLSPNDPVEIVVPAESGVRPQFGLRVHRGEISPDEVVSVQGLQATGVLRTLADLCLRWSPVEALVAIDMALVARLTDGDAVTRHAEALKGRPGARRLRELAAIAAHAESPMETRMRWIILQAGLPHPTVQADLRDGEGRFLGRADLYFPAARLVVEYDGDNHRERLVHDNRRQNLLVNAGFRLLRFTASDVHQRPQVVVAQISAALRFGTPDVKRALGVA